jgi:hypothetical protein
MNFTFRRGVREEVGLLIGLIGPSGGGKTFSAMRLAKGICGDDPFAVIDTEAGRAKHYADDFKFDHGDLKPPFTPDVYSGAIKAAEDAGYKAIIVDSASHVWAGDGGVLDMHETELARLTKGDPSRSENFNMLAWNRPKSEHKRMVSRLLQLRSSVILCLRAEEKIKMEKGADGKTKIVPQGWQPICEKNLPYELTISFLLTPDNPGVGKPIKLEKQHLEIFPAGEKIGEECGRRILDWSKGGEKKKAPEPKKEKRKAPAKDFLATINEQYQRIGAESFHEIMNKFGITSPEEITEREKQVEFFRALIGQKGVGA